MWMYLSYPPYPPLASLGRFVHLYVTSSYWSRFKSGQRSGRHSSSTLSVFCNTATLKIAPSFVVPTWVTPMVYSQKMLQHSLNPQRPQSRHSRLSSEDRCCLRQLNLPMYRNTRVHIPTC